MTKGKKKKELTIEEKLEQALVPREEWPYEVPENWCWVRLGDLYEINPKNNADNNIESSFIPMEKIEAGFKSEFTYEIKTWGDAKKGHTQFADGDVAFAKISPCFENRKSMIIKGLKNGIGAGTTELIVLRQPLVDQMYTFWIVSSDDFVSKGKATYSGTVGQQRISMDYVRNYPIPLPPLPEQQRIVNRIESLFSKLDEAKEKAQEALDSFEMRKAAILHKAFSGELTEKWREEKGVGIDNWEIIKLSDCSTSIGDGLHGTPVFDDNGEYYFVNGNNFQIDHLNIKPDTKKVNEEEYKKYYINLSKENTVFVSINGTLGKTSFYNDEPIILGKSACYINVNERIDKYYLRYYFETKEFIDYANEKATGSTIKNLGLKAIRNMEIRLPNILEQRIIVKVLDDIIKNEYIYREIIYDVLFQIDIIKKSILAKAFRGELGTNCLEEESSINILKSII